MGYLYVLTNPGMPGLVKVGHGSPRRRAKQLSTASGVPFPFEVAAEWEVRDARRAEKLAHACLAEFRGNKRREFFEIDVKEAKQRIESVLIQVGERKTPARTAQRPTAPTPHSVPRLPGTPVRSQSSERYRGQSVWEAVREDQKRVGWK
jgi:hypothetical protein